MSFYVLAKTFDWKTCTGLYKFTGENCAHYKSSYFKNKNLTINNNTYFGTSNITDCSCA